MRIQCALLLGTALIALSGCVTFPTLESEQVNVVWDHPALLEECEHKGIVFGSEGHFYDYWLHADKDMVWGALNQMRIKTAEQGGNTLYLYQPFDFRTSVTFLGKAYQCPPTNASINVPTNVPTNAPVVAQ